MSARQESESVASVLARAYELFVTSEQESRSSLPKSIEIDDKRFVGFTATSEGRLSSADLRHSILSSLQFEEQQNIRVVQVVGDSGTAFDSEVLVAAQKLLESHIDERTVIEYGFTCSQHDANWLVTNFLSRDSNVANQAIANVVGQSIEALRSPTWLGPELVRKFVLLYREDGSYTQFGEDTWLSDGIMSAQAGDEMLCFEGGLQAFHQCCNTLLQGIKVVAMTDLRSHSEPSRFSAARLLLQLKEAHGTTALEDRVRECLKAYPVNNDKQVDAIQADVRRLAQADKDWPRLLTIA